MAYTEEERKAIRERFEEVAKRTLTRYVENARRRNILTRPATEKGWLANWDEPCDCT